MAGLGKKREDLCEAVRTAWDAEEAVPGHYEIGSTALAGALQPADDLRNK